MFCSNTFLVQATSADVPKPTGTPGPKADAFAKRMQVAVRMDDWERTKAVRWSFRGVRHHVWDRRRGMVEVKWDDMRVLLRTGPKTGLAFRKGTAVRGKELEEALREAFGYWINDSFWLNPFRTFFDEGVTRALVTEKDRSEKLLVSYGSGGVTPGDSYLWTTDENGLPTEWQMWVQVIPVGGIKTSWQGWVDLETGAKISTVHKGIGANATFIRDLSGGPDLVSIGADPELFAPLFAAD